MSNSLDMVLLKSVFKKDIALNAHLFDCVPKDWTYVALGWAAGRDLSNEDIKTFVREVQFDTSLKSALDDTLILFKQPTN